MLDWPPRRWVGAVVVAVAAGVVTGVPTGIIRTGLYHRMTPVLWWNYPVWAIAAVLIGLTGATYVVRTSSPTGPIAGGVLSTLAVGCPICNKLVVTAIGVSGALNVWAPLQPWLGVGSLFLLALAFRRRLLGERACAVGTAT